MNDEKLKKQIGANIAAYRKRLGLTQAGLAEKLNYSDKTVSKWERAESSPDITVLIEIANLFGVTLDYLVKAEHPEEPGPSDLPEGGANLPEKPVASAEDAKAPAQSPHDEIRYNRRAIAYISESVAWIVAIFAFIITTLISKRVTSQFLYFVYALPIVLIVKLVFNSVWFNPRRNYLIVSLLMWALLAAIQITFLYFGVNVALIYLLGAAGQAVIVLWSFISRPKK
jgi:transcriptional regulator with XRE-family HTH domain